MADIILYKRAVTDEIMKFIDTSEVLVLHGARQVGKTHILYCLRNFLQKKREDTYYIDLEDSRYVKILDTGVDYFLKHLLERGFDLDKRLVVFIDEIQYLKNPSEFLKLVADHHKNIRLIVSGSSSFEIKSKFKDSLVGRTVNFEIFTLSFQEFLVFKGYLKGTSDIFTQIGVDELKILFSEYTLFGGYPKIVLTNEVEKKEYYLQQIIDTYIKKDIRDLANIRDVDKFNKLLEILAAQSGNLLNVIELSNTCKIAKQTVENYLFILENTYIIRLVHPYSKNIRSELFKVPKIYFYDTGLMQMLWLKSLQSVVIGNVFETAVFSELVKLYKKDSVFYWRTRDRKEIDFILRIKNNILPIEVKSNFAAFQSSAIDFFNSKYHLSAYKVIGLEGKIENKHCSYPWEL